MISQKFRPDVLISLMHAELSRKFIECILYSAVLSFFTFCSPVYRFSYKLPDRKYSVLKLRFELDENRTFPIRFDLKLSSDFPETKYSYQWEKYFLYKYPDPPLISEKIDYSLHSQTSHLDTALHILSGQYYGSLSSEGKFFVMIGYFTENRHSGDILHYEKKECETVSVSADPAQIQTPFETHRCPPLGFTEGEIQILSLHRLEGSQTEKFSVSLQRR